MDKNLKREARIITEMYDDLFADGIKETSDFKDDGWGGRTYQSAEQFEAIPEKLRSEVLNCINEKFNTSIDIHDEEFNFNGKCIVLRGWFLVDFPYGNAVKQRFDLAEMDAHDFREVIGDVLVTIPGGMQYFRDIGEASPFYLRQIRGI
jgi:hypothetical protein